MAGTIDTIGNALGFVTNDWQAASFREKFGQSLFGNDEKRLQEYRELDIAKVNMQAMRSLDQIDADKKDDSIELTGGRRNLEARTVAQSFMPAAGMDLRLMAPIRA
jgi:hypothetical protein